MVESTWCITSFHNLMYITHNRVYQGEGGREGARVADGGSRAVPYVRERFRQRVPSPALARNKHKSSEAYLAAPRRTLK